jgi:cytochrome c5
MRHPLASTSAAVLLLAVSGIAAAQLPGGSRRGQMLYENHCSACHTTEVHWRDKKLARDWDGLILQVRIWQGNGKLNEQLRVDRPETECEETIRQCAQAMSDLVRQIRGLAA